MQTHIMVTMDVEVPRPHPDASGPESWEASEAYIRAYTDMAHQRGYPVSFFIHPEAALHHAPLFKELHETHGAFIDGLHLHPWKFYTGRYRAHFGGLTADEQRQAISEATALWQHAFGWRPNYFRPGTFSANDSTFAVLTELGFRGGSVSAPGRYFPDLQAVWPGAPRDPHRPHHCFRLIPGELEFANVPLTHDYTDPVQRGQRRCYRDLRPDALDVDHIAMMRRIAEQLAARQPRVPIMHFDTHNDNDYTDPNNPVRQNYETLLDGFADACAQAGLQAVGSTMDHVCDLVLAEVDAPAEFVPA